MTDLIERDDTAQELAAQTKALTDGITAARKAATYWRTAADFLTDLRVDGMNNLPITPNAGSWDPVGYNTERPALPFTDFSLNHELNRLSDLIAQAHTIAVLYSEEADRLDAELAEANRQRGQYTPAQVAAAQALADATAAADRATLNEPEYFTPAWMEWDSTRDAAEAERADARSAYVALFDGDAPDPRDLIA